MASIILRPWIFFFFASTLAFFPVMSTSHSHSSRRRWPKCLLSSTINKPVSAQWQNEASNRERFGQSRYLRVQQSLPNLTSGMPFPMLKAHLLPPSLSPPLHTAFITRTFPSSPSSSSTNSKSSSLLPSKSLTQRDNKTCCSAFHLTYQGNDENDLVALVTGGSRGIGKSIVDRLSDGGVKHVLIVARGQQACDDAANELIQKGFSASGHAVNVADGDAVSNLCENLLSKFPRIDILVNNAGITRDNLFMRMSKEEWVDVINTNLNSAFYFTSPIIKRMIKNKFGRIINMSSVIGLGGNPGQANYAASKAGLIGMTKALGKEYANRGITVNAIAPGFIASEMTKKMPQKTIEQILGKIPMGRMGTPDEVADLAAFLASDQSAYITGKVFAIDGGMLFGGS